MRAPSLWMFLTPSREHKKCGHQMARVENPESSSIKVCLPRLASIKVRLLSKVVFHQKLSSIKHTSFIKGCLSSIVVFHKKMSSLNGHLPSMVVFLQRLSFIKECFPSIGNLHLWSSSIQGCLPSTVIFHQRLSSIIGCLPIWILTIKFGKMESSKIHIIGRMN